MLWYFTPPSATWGLRVLLNICDFLFFLDRQCLPTQWRLNIISLPFFFNRGIVGIQYHIHFCLRLFLDIHANRGAISPITPAAPPAGTRPRRGGIPCAGLCARDSSVRTTLHFLAQPPPLWPSRAVLCIRESVSVCVCRFRTDADPRGIGLPLSGAFHAAPWPRGPSTSTHAVSVRF